MPDRVIANPIINGPYAEPTRHFRFDDDGISDETVEGRRPSSYFVPVPRPRKGAPQLHIGELTAEGGHRRCRRGVAGRCADGEPGVGPGSAVRTSRRLVVAMKHERVEIELTGPGDGTELAVNENAVEETVIAQWLEHAVREVGDVVLAYHTIVEGDLDDPVSEYPNADDARQAGPSRHVVTSFVRSDAPRVLPSLDIVPRLAQLGLMSLRPRQDAVLYPTRQAPIGHLQRVDRHHDVPTAVGRMEVRRRMVVPEHSDGDPSEGRQPGHDRSSWSLT